MTFKLHPVFDNKSYYQTQEVPMNIQMQKAVKKLIIATVLSSICAGSMAHDIWIKADTHEITNDEQKIFALDVSRSAQAFVADANHEVKQLTITSPNGDQKTIDADYSGRVKEVFEVEFSQAGTYHIESPMTQVFLSFYHDPAGKKHKIRMPKTQYHTLPAGAKPEKTIEKQIITETYISYNGFTDVKNTRTQGLQIHFDQHPNKIRAGKDFSFSVTFNGKPVDEAEVSLKSLNQFYYQNSDKVEVMLKAKDKGEVTLVGEQPGRYLIGVEYAMTLNNDPMADMRSVERFVTFEITQ